ncbi:MAG: EAL domain-containing protein [Lachnospiraceae bacterium]|nr:EAL domain-containing protein [Lachnospiraceae bacterium]
MKKSTLEDVLSSRESELFHLLASISYDFLIIFDVNENRAKIVQCVEGNERGSTIRDHLTEHLSEKVHPDDLSLLEKELKNLTLKVDHVGFEIRLRESGGRRYRWHSVKLRLIPTDDGIFYVGASTYIDNSKRDVDELTIKARQDPLTGLLNKVVTTEQITNYIAKNPEKKGALMIVDIDFFKSFNDTMGHLFGDEVIKEVAIRIRRIFSCDSFVGRVGGDEFLVYVKNLADVSDLVSRLGRLRDSLYSITLGQRSSLRVTASIGISLFPEMGDDFTKLFDAADMALYFVKNNGRNNFAIYTELLYDESKRRAEKCEEEETRQTEAYSITNFAFHLLNESEDVDSALNLLLYKIQNEYNLEAIYVNEVANNKASSECIYEIKKDKYESRLGSTEKFSFKASENKSDAFKRNGGYLIYELKGENAMDPGNSLLGTEGMGSVLQIDMRLFSESRGLVNYVSEYGKVIWTKQKIKDLIAITNLITVCLYYSKRVLKAEAEVVRMSDYDLLTGLMKEDTFIDACKKIIVSRKKNMRLAILYCDISNFKYINDTYGYLKGDNILAETSKFMKEKIPNVLAMGRFYSDNIVCLTEFPDTMSEGRLAEIMDLINKDLAKSLEERFNINNIFISAGIYVLDSPDVDIYQAVSNANLARKISKGQNSLNCVIFSQEMFEKKRRQIQLMQQLDSALKNEEFYIVMQPKVSGSENRLIGAEALVRWQRPDGSVIFPDEFISTFEKDGSIIKLDFYVYDKVMKYLHDRLKAHKKVVPISMNVSRAHLLEEDFVKRFRALIDKYEIPTQYIELELTESIYLENLDFFNKTMEEFRNMGIRVSMDDFGSGYSSLNALNDIKIDLLKIDRIFMKDPNLRESDKTIIKFIIDMAKNLCIQVMCEGVETKTQRDFLNKAGCTLQQGYLYSKPVEIDTFNVFLDNEDILFARVG